MRNNSTVRALAVLAAILPALRLKADDTQTVGVGTERSFVVSGYLPWYRIDDWSPDRIGPVTNLIYFGLELDEDGGLNTERVTAAAIERLRAAREMSGCRLQFCVAGGGRSGGFEAATSSEAARQRLCDSLVNLCREHGFDGVDFDWEYPEGERQLRDFALLLERMKRQLGEHGVVSEAQPPWQNFGRGVYSIVDRVHLMSYNHRHPQARFEKSQRDVARVLEYGCPAEKLVLGMPFYGRNAAGRTRTFAELAQFGRLDPAADMLIGYAFNGRETVRAKTQFAINENLGGVMIWELGQDASDPDVSLLQAIDLELGDHRLSSHSTHPLPFSLKQ